MADTNLNLYDNYVDHFADARRYEEKVKISIGRTMSRHQKRLRDAYLKNPASPNFQPELRRFATELNSLVVNSISEYGDTAISFFTNELDSAVGSFFKVTRPKSGSAFPKVVGPSFSSLSIEKSVANIANYSELRLNSIVKRANKNQDPRKDTLSKLLNSTAFAESQAKSLTRTALTNAQYNANMAVVNENKEVIKGLRYTAILDSRTTSLCASRDGKVFTLSEDKYPLPAHYNCRSSYVPVILSKKELSSIDSTKIKKTVLAETTGLSGQIPQVETFNNWLKRQTMEIKLKYLGTEEKVGLFEKGAVELSSFISGAGNAISIEALRRLDNLRTIVFRTRQSSTTNQIGLPDARRPYDLIRSAETQRLLREFYLSDAIDSRQALSLIDYRGTSLIGKKTSRSRSNNEFDERNNSFDPFTGEQNSTLLYDPDFGVLQERLDFITNSKALTQDQKKWIIEFVESLEDTISVNQQTSIAENLRVVFERYNLKKEPWDNLVAVLRSEMNFSVVNTSRILDRRSRARSSQFEAFGVAGEPAKIQIQGNYYTFENIVDNTLDNQRFIQSWQARFATPISTSVYYRGRSPLFTYFRGPIGRDTLAKQFKKKLEDFVKKIPGGKLYLNRNKPTESMMVEFIRSKREALRKIIDLEFLFNKNKLNYLDELVIETIGGREAIRVLNKVTQLIASGTSTDYDTLAINIGRLLREEWKLTEKHVFPFWKPTLQDYHADGSKILTAFRDQGFIRVVSRGVTRRSVIDLDTGRASGPWRDTVSREVQILNKDMLALQVANRANLTSRRIGIVNDRDRLFVRPGQKNYFDARGRDTGIPIVTRRANANYDTDLIDRDFADMLNHTMSVKYEVDNDFAGFMEELVRFRDPRGNVQKYDDLNAFRKLILTRGDQGYGLMQTVKFHRENGRPFSVIANIDGRGRVYYQGFLTPTGGTVARPFLNSSRAYNMNLDALRELSLQLGVMVADTTEGLSNSGRIAAFLRNEKGFRELGELLLTKTQRDRRIREFLEHPLVRATDPEDLPQLTRLALEYTRIYNHVDGNLNDVAKLSTYRTKLMVDNDASASGAQIIALATRDRLLAQNSNVVPTVQKNRLYDLVAMDTVSDPDFQKIRALVDAGITWEDLQKAAKSANMVQLYGAGRATISLNVEAKLADVLEKKGFQIITREELRDFNKLIDDKIDQAKILNADEVITELRQLKRELNEALEGQVSLNSQLMRAARDVHPDAETFVDKLNNTRLIGPQVFKDVSNIMSKYLAERAPVTQNYIVFWKEVGETFVRETGRVDIPWVTFDGKKLYQRYRPKIQTAIQFFDNQSRRLVRNIYEDKADDAKLLGKSSIGSARIGLGVNGTHMSDASIVRLYHLWGRKNNVDTFTVHDAFGTNLALSTTSKQALRQIYADAVEADSIRATLKAMKSDGLSEKSYNYFVNKAREMGLLDLENPLTKEEILARLKPGFDFYGVGL